MSRPRPTTRPRHEARAGRLGRARAARRPRDAVPAERLAFVLHDVFGVPFDEIAPIVERTPAAARQLASRARRRVQAEAPDPGRRPRRPARGGRRVPGRGRAATSRRSSGSSIPTSCSGPTAVASARSRGRRSRGRERRARAPAVRAALRRLRPAGDRQWRSRRGRPGRAGPAADRRGFTIRAGRIAAIDLNGDPAKTSRAIRDLA